MANSGATPTVPYGHAELTFDTAGSAAAVDLDLSENAVGRHIRSIVVHSKNNEVWVNTEGETSTGFPVPAGQAVRIHLGKAWRARANRAVKVWLPSGASLNDTVYVLLEDES